MSATIPNDCRGWTVRFREDVRNGYGDVRRAGDTAVVTSQYPGPDQGPPRLVDVRWGTSEKQFQPHMGQLDGVPVAVLVFEVGP